MAFKGCIPSRWPDQLQEPSSQPSPRGSGFGVVWELEPAQMRITEIFFSIQGESTHAGEPCVFVRLTGCSLRCVYCDTKYSYAGGRDMSLEDVLSTVAGHPAKLV